MSTATPHEHQATSPRSASASFVADLNRRFGPVPNGHTRILGSSAIGTRDPAAGPTYPRSVRSYARSQDIVDGAAWCHVLNQGMNCAVWDVPTPTWKRNDRGSIDARVWQSHYRGVILCPAAAAVSADASAPAAPSPYSSRPWFRVQIDVQDRQLRATRTIYPRAYEHWSDEERQVAVGRVEQGHTVDAIAHDLQRQPEAVAICMWKCAAEVARRCGIPQPMSLRRGSSELAPAAPDRETQPERSAPPARNGDVPPPSSAAPVRIDLGGDVALPQNPPSLSVHDPAPAHSRPTEEEPMLRTRTAPNSAPALVPPAPRPRTLTDRLLQVTQTVARHLGMSGAESAPAIADVGEPTDQHTTGERALLAVLAGDHTPGSIPVPWLSFEVPERPFPAPIRMPSAVAEAPECVDGPSLQELMRMPLLTPRLEEVYADRQVHPEPETMLASQPTPSQMLTFATEVRRDLKSRGMGTRQIAQVLDLVRVAQS